MRQIVIAWDSWEEAMLRSQGYLFSSSIEGHSRARGSYYGCIMVKP